MKEIISFTILLLTIFEMSASIDDHNIENENCRNLYLLIDTIPQKTDAQKTERRNRRKGVRYDSGTTPLANSWNSTNPSDKALNSSLRDYNKRIISDKWMSGNGNFNISFRKLIGSNLIKQSEGVSNWFAACGTLSGMYDQVKVTQMEVEAKTGYWEQFMKTYGRTDPSVFQDFNFKAYETELTEYTGKDLSLLMQVHGPLVVISKKNNKAFVLVEIDYEAAAGEPYSVYYFDPAQTLRTHENWSPNSSGTLSSDLQEKLHRPRKLKEGENWYDPSYPGSIDNSLIPIKTMLTRLNDFNDNELKVPVYILWDPNYDQTKGYSQREFHDNIEKEKMLARKKALEQLWNNQPSNSKN